MIEVSKKVQIMIHRSMKQVKDALCLDFENRWKKMSIMIDACYVLRDVSEAMANKDEFCNELGKHLQLDWRQIKTVKDFLDPVFELKTAAGGSKFTSLWILPTVFECLEEHCRSTI